MWPACMMGSIIDVNVVLMLIIYGPILAFVPLLIYSLPLKSVNYRSVEHRNISGNKCLSALVCNNNVYPFAYGLHNTG